MNRNWTSLSAEKIAIESQAAMYLLFTFSILGGRIWTGSTAKATAAGRFYSHIVLLDMAFWCQGINLRQLLQNIFFGVFQQITKGN